MQDKVMEMILRGRDPNPNPPSGLFLWPLLTPKLQNCTNQWVTPQQLHLLFNTYFGATGALIPQIQLIQSGSMKQFHIVWKES